ncbi:MAG: hypothetical protein F6K63_16710 [Moorea sp. SIO1G6]|uniref:hypothetical protein n=1 Tax=Moorena sp. SIO1G6 TaxID=2607840 RepID=UPI0013BFBE32|nr:hypothetical protein [Moorena sp. SIO1G6]NET65936.1 hypothetical protein [Moorena sp. SIO1G6]
MKKHGVINVLAILIDVVANRLNFLIKALSPCSLFPTPCSLKPRMKVPQAIENCTN